MSTLVLQPVNLLLLNYIHSLNVVICSYWKQSVSKCVEYFTIETFKQLKFLSVVLKFLKKLSENNENGHTLNASCT